MKTKLVRVEPTAAEAEDRHGSSESRVGRCYELAYDYVVEHNGGDVTLIHGTIDSDVADVPIGHGWVKLRHGSVVFDGSRGGKFYERQSYYRIMRAVVEHRYPQADALGWQTATNHCGPWEPTSGPKVAEKTPQARRTKKRKAPP